MRGSPWFRTLIVAVLLGVAAWGIASLTAERSRAISVTKPTPTSHDASASTIPTRFHLMLSAMAEEAVIELDGQSHALELNDHGATGTLMLEGPRPTIFLTVRWAEKTTTPKFAKLTLEPQGWPTRQQTFDGPGDLDEVWEPDFES